MAAASVRRVEPGSVGAGRGGGGELRVLTFRVVAEGFVSLELKP